MKKISLRSGLVSAILICWLMLIVIFVTLSGILLNNNYRKSIQQEIRSVYPDYASNMKDSMMAVAADGKHYAVPSAGFWENMFVNKALLTARLSGTTAIPPLSAPCLRFPTTGSSSLS